VPMLFVGIDVSKDYSSAQGLDREGKKVFYLEFAMNGEGFSQFLKLLKTHGEDGIYGLLPHQSICFFLFGGDGLCGDQPSADF